MLLSVVCFCGGFGGLLGGLGALGQILGVAGEISYCSGIHSPSQTHEHKRTCTLYISFSRSRALAHTCVRVYARTHVYICPLKKKHTHTPDGLKVYSSGPFQRLRRQLFTKLNPKPETRNPEARIPKL
jgi:hypothetical protein